MEVAQTKAGLYTVTFGYNEVDAQEAAFAANGLKIVSPAQLGFLRAMQKEGATFNPYSRTGADVFYDGKQVVVVPDGAISGLVGIANIVDAHRQKGEYIIPKSQRDLVYAMVNEMLRKGTAVAANHGRTDIPTSQFGQTELTFKLFSDYALGIKAQDYGDWQKEQGIYVQLILFNNADYAKSQKGQYVDRLRVFGPDNDFVVGGVNGNLDNNNGAFGVSFKKTTEVV